MDLTTIVNVVIGIVWILFGLVLIRVRRQGRISDGWLLLGALFCALRAFDRIVVSAAGVDAEGVILVLDVTALIMLVAVAFGTTRVGNVMEDRLDEADQAQSEYGRALLDYTQLVRHRIANPLTAVKGGIQTLLDLDLDEPVRRSLLESMLASAIQLECVALHPDPVGAEEHELNATPAPSERDQSPGVLADAGHAEADFRDVNRELIEVVPDTQRHVSFVCECAARDCTAPVAMTIDEYYDVHRDATQFVVVPGHDEPAVEDVVRREPEWWVVKKRGKPARDARSRA